MNQIRYSKEQVIVSLAQKLQDVRLLQLTMRHLSHENPEPAIPRFDPWDDLSLGGGYAGLIMLFSVLYQHGWLSKDQEDVVHEYVLKIKEFIETNGIASLSLFSGLTGVCYALHLGSMGGVRYQKMLATLRDYL